MKILALDASTEALSVALLNGESATDSHEYFEIAPRAHADRLLPLAQRLLDEHDLALSDLDALAFGRGPGAFTGLRIAAGLVQGLAWGAALPVAPVSTLQALAWRALQHHDGSHVRVVQDARMGEIYTADFRHSEDGPPIRLGEERVMAPAQLQSLPAAHWLCAGNGWAVVAEHTGMTSPAVCEQWPHAQDIALLGAGMLTRGETVAAAAALPVYVRDDVARKPAARNS